MDSHVCGPETTATSEVFRSVNEKSTKSLPASALNFIWTLQSEEEDRGHCSPCLNQRSVFAHGSAEPQALSKLPTNEAQR